MHTFIHTLNILNVCNNVYVQYHKEARDTQDLLKRLDTELNQKYNPEFKDVYQMEGLIREIDVRTFLPLNLNTTHDNCPQYCRGVIPFVCMRVCLCAYRIKPRPWITLTTGSRLFRSAACKFCPCPTAVKLHRNFCQLKLCVSLTQMRYVVCVPRLILSTSIS